MENGPTLSLLPEKDNSDFEENIPSHLIISNLGRARFKPKLERAHRSVPIPTQYIIRTIKEKHRGYVVKKQVCSGDPNDTQSSQESSSFTSNEIEMSSTLNHIGINDLDIQDTETDTDSGMSFFFRHNVAHYLEAAARELDAVTTDSSDVLTNISSIDLISNSVSSHDSDVLSDVSSIHNRGTTVETAEHQKRTT
ncbi:hypothetical protein M8J75_013299 [Diaphorina citri]|nr:hypothetical protein M8J75_013299 [Diaphorina citri]